MAEIEQAASRINLWTSLIERSGKLANALGWDITPAKIVNAVWPIVVMVSVMIWQHAAWFVIMPVAVFTFGSLLHLYSGVVRAMAVQGIKKISLIDVATMCERVEKGFYDFVEARAEEVAEFSGISRPPKGVDFMDYHEARHAKETEFMGRMKARIGSDLAAAVAMLNSLGIKAESDLRSLQWADGIARYYGAQAILLRGGHLSEAKSLDRHQLFF